MCYTQVRIAVRNLNQSISLAYSSIQPAYTAVYTLFPISNVYEDYANSREFLVRLDRLALVSSLAGIFFLDVSSAQGYSYKYAAR